MPLSTHYIDVALNLENVVLTDKFGTETTLTPYDVYPPVTQSCGIFWGTVQFRLHDSREIRLTGIRNGATHALFWVFRFLCGCFSRMKPLEAL